MQLSDQLESMEHLNLELQETPETYKFKDASHRIKLLSIRWFPLQDVFNFTKSEDNHFRGVKTERKMLFDIVKMYDSLGWLSPLVIFFETLVQKT